MLVLPAIECDYSISGLILDLHFISLQRNVFERIDVAFVFIWLIFWVGNPKMYSLLKNILDGVQPNTSTFSTQDII